LLAALILLFALEALLGPGGKRQLLAIVFSLVLVSAVVATFPRGRHRLVGAILAGAALTGHWCGVFLTGPKEAAAQLAEYSVVAVFLTYALGVILAGILAERDITADSICAAVCGYLFLGLACGLLYAQVETLWPGSFFVRPEFASQLTNTVERRALLTYYSFVTLTTAGYGDITPLSPPARTLSWLEAVAGLFYMTILVAGLVGIRISQMTSMPEREHQEVGSTTGPSETDASRKDQAGQ